MAQAGRGGKRDDRRFSQKESLHPENLPLPYRHITGDNWGIKRIFPFHRRKSLPYGSASTKNMPF